MRDHALELVRPDDLRDDAGPGLLEHGAIDQLLCSLIRGCDNNAKKR